MGVHYDKNRKKYKASVQRTIAGVKYKKQKRFEDETLAWKWHDETVESLLLKAHTGDGRPPVPKSVLSESPDPMFYDMAEDYIQTILPQHPSYVAQPSNVFTRVQQLHNKKKLSDFTSKYLTECAFHRVNVDGIAVPTAKKEATAVKQILNYARAHHDWKHDPSVWPLTPDFPKDTRLKRNIRGYQDTKPITPDQAIKLLRWVKEIDFQVYLALIIYYETSLRRREAVIMDRNWVQLNFPAMIVLPEEYQKNYEEKELMLTPAAKQAVEQGLNYNWPDGRVLHFDQKTDKAKGAYILRIFKHGCDEVLNRPKLVIHQLRKNNASMQRMDTDMPNDVRQRQTGHMDEKVLDKIYTQLTPEYRAQFYQKSFLGIDNIMDI